MEAIAIVTILALGQVFFYAFEVGKARAKYGVKAPVTTGTPDFESAFRVHQNTVEQLIIFVPALWLFGFYVHGLIGAAIGLVFIVSRLMYRNAYLNEPASRATGFGLGALTLAVLSLGGLIGAALSWYRG